MAVTKQLISAGDGKTRPQRGDTISMEYTGWVYDANAPNNKGSQYVFKALRNRDFIFRS